MALPITSKWHPLTTSSPLHPLTNKKFGVFWVGAFLSSLGFWIQSVGQGWQVLQMTNSALLLGLVTFAATVPNVVLSLFGGVIVDRINRRHIIIGTQVIYMCTSLLLGILTSLNRITVWQIVLVAFINGVFSSVGFPAWQAFISDLVPAHELKQGIALNSVQFNLSRVIGPAIGGISVGVVGIAGSYYCNALSYIAVIIPLLLMRPEQKQGTVVRQGIWRGLSEGLKYVSEHTILVLALSLQLMIAFLVYPYATLLPIFARDIFHIGATGLGVLNAAAGIGAFAGSVFVVMLSRRMENNVLALKLLCSIGGVVCIAFALMHALQPALLFLVVLGACTVMSSTITNTTIQTVVPEHMRGRVLSIWALILFGVAPFGNLLSGWVAQALGAPMTLGIGGGLCALNVLALVCIQFALKSRSQMKVA